MTAQCDYVSGYQCISLAGSVTALMLCLIRGNLLVIPGLAAAACNAAGNLIGSRIVTDHGALVVRPVILVVLVLLLLRVLRVCQMESPSGSEQKEA